MWNKRSAVCGAFLFFALLTDAHAQAGPPFQTDDPTPVD
jgi:hypothetical protein